LALCIKNVGKAVENPACAFHINTISKSGKKTTGIRTTHSFQPKLPRKLSGCNHMTCAERTEGGNMRKARVICAMEWQSRYWALQ